MKHSLRQVRVNLGCLCKLGRVPQLNHSRTLWGSPDKTPAPGWSAVHGKVKLTSHGQVGSLAPNGAEPSAWKQSLVRNPKCWLRPTCLSHPPVSRNPNPVAKLQSGNVVWGILTRMPVAVTLKLSQAGEDHRRLAASHVGGKIVFLP